MSHMHGIARMTVSPSIARAAKLKRYLARKVQTDGFVEIEIAKIVATAKIGHVLAHPVLGSFGIACLEGIYDAAMRLVETLWTSLGIVGMREQLLQGRIEQQ